MGHRTWAQAGFAALLSAWLFSGVVSAEPLERVEAELVTETPAAPAESAEAALPADPIPVPEACDPFFDESCDDEDLSSLAHFPDPWEEYNRGTLSFNEGFDRWVFDPLTSLYQLLPDPVENAFLRSIQNLDCPAIAVNDGLQLEWADMGITLSRFAINSTIGIAGFFDPAAAWGIEAHSSDFGQTLTLAGFPSGPYLILPVLGPTTVRDGFGSVADTAMSPLLYVFGLASFETLAQAGSSGIAVRADKIQELQSLEQGSIDFYAALRSAFYQNRQAEIWGRREHRRQDAAAILQPVVHRPAAVPREAVEVD